MARQGATSSQPLHSCTATSGCNAQCCTTKPLVAGRRFIWMADCFIFTRQPQCTICNGKPANCQTQTAEAERDALQALFELGSPRTTQFPGHLGTSQDLTSASSQISPRHSDTFATPRRIKPVRSESSNSLQLSSSEAEDETSFVSQGRSTGLTEVH